MLELELKLDCTLGLLLACPLVHVLERRLVLELGLKLVRALELLLVC